MIELVVNICIMYQQLYNNYITHHLTKVYTISDNNKFDDIRRCKII